MITAKLDLKSYPSSPSTLVKGTEVQVVELGLRRIEALYLTSIGSIQVTDEITLSGKQIISEERTGWRAFVLPPNGDTLYQLYDTHKNALFSANLQDCVGSAQ